MTFGNFSLWAAACLRVPLVIVFPRDRLAGTGRSAVVQSSPACEASADQASRSAHN